MQDTFRLQAYRCDNKHLSVVDRYSTVTRPLLDRYMDRYMDRYNLQNTQALGILVFWAGVKR